MQAYWALSAAQQVVGYLLRHEQPPEGALVVDLPARKQVIASPSNLSPETFSRILHGLAQARLIRVEGRRITIPDVEALRRHGG